VIGSRQASSAGIGRARVAVEELVDAGYTVVSGLAAGVDTAAHNAALERGGRTVAVIGTGLERAYPPQNALLQRTIAETGAVVSQFLPDAGPERPHFPLRNAVMSGLAVATLVVEASQTSGARTQVRSALAHGRPVLLAGALLDQQWARELAGRPGVYVVRSPSELSEVLARISATDALAA
jgi:DNA processing protein